MFKAPSPNGVFTIFQLAVQSTIYQCVFKVLSQLDVQRTMHFVEQLVLLAGVLQISPTLSQVLKLPPPVMALVRLTLWAKRTFPALDHLVG